jgi:hypothetical protein
VFPLALPPPPPMHSMVLLEEFQSTGTVQVVPEVRKIVVEALACCVPNENKKKANASTNTTEIERKDSLSFKIIYQLYPSSKKFRAYT